MLHSQVLGSGPELVLLHGWGMNSAVWEDMVTVLATKFQVRCIDLPGHGYSHWNNTDLNITDWATECLKIAAPKAIWLGWSLGGSVALAAALQAPERLRAIILITATPCFLSNKHWPHGIQTETLIGFRQNLIINLAETISHFLTLQMRGSNSSHIILRSLRHCLAKYPPPLPLALDVGLDILLNTDFSLQLANLQLPSLWLYGNRDTLIPWQGSETLAQLLPTARIAILNGAAHAPFLSHRQQVLELLDHFIAELK